jgi:hypothetical protein
VTLIIKETLTMVILRTLLLALLASLEFRHILAADVVVNTLEKSDESNASRTADNTCQAENNGTCQPEVAPNASSVNSQCAVWVAMSTLPGAGIGIFAGKSFHSGEQMMRSGDHAIPIVDLLMYHGERGDDPHFFLWDEYTWDAESLGCQTLGITNVHVASSGFGAVPNGFMDFVNVDEDYPIHSVPQNIHRSKDPGAGAFTYYHSRMAKARYAIKPGQELFVKYGNNW